MPEPPLRPSLLGRLQASLARRIFRLPHSLQVRLSGSAPIVIDGLALHPEIQLLLALRRLVGASSLGAETPEIGRRRMREEAVDFSGLAAEPASVRSLSLSLGPRTLRARHYTPAEPGPHPLLVFLHGGAFILGDLDTHDDPCRRLCCHAGVQVLSVDYRLAPEHPFPAAVEDSVLSLEWALEHAKELGADRSRVGMGGDSAGANLSTVVAQLRVREGREAPAFQFLIYPATDRTRPWPSIDFFAEGFFLTKRDLGWAVELYCPGHQRDPRVSPLLASDLSGQCPAYVVTAGFDPLRDEGEAYAAALKAAGVRVVHRRFDGMIHGFLNMASVSPAAHDAVLEVARGLRELAHGPVRSGNGARSG